MAGKENKPKVLLGLKTVAFSSYFPSNRRSNRCLTLVFSYLIELKKTRRERTGNSISPILVPGFVASVHLLAHPRYNGRVLGRIHPNVRRAYGEVLQAEGTRNHR